jgi:hypothetical protein
MANNKKKQQIDEECEYGVREKGGEKVGHLFNHYKNYCYIFARINFAEIIIKKKNKTLIKHC